MVKNKVCFGWGLLVLLVAGCKPAAPVAPAPPPLKVPVMTVTPKDVPIFQQWIGTLDGYPNAQIRAQISGYLIKQDYLEGSAVKKGELLFEVDPRPFQAALDQARGKLAQDQAQLGKTELDVKRYTPLALDKAISQEVMDDAMQANLMAQASIQADKAAVESAALNLEFCRITSPVDGIAGTAQAQIGDLVGPGSAVLTTVSTVQPIRAYFNVSEQFYLTYSRLHGTSAESAVPLELLLSDGTVYPRSGRWLFTSRQVDINTGTVQVAAEFENPNSLLRPGAYALVRAQTDLRTNALLVPQRAVTELQGSYQIATVTQTNTVHLQKVKVGDQIGSEWIIESGLEANGRVVVEGLLRAKEGVVLDPQPYIAGTTNSEAPLKK